MARMGNLQSLSEEKKDLKGGGHNLHNPSPSYATTAKQLTAQGLVWSVSQLRRSPRSPRLPLVRDTAKPYRIDHVHTGGGQNQSKRLMHWIPSHATHSVKINPGRLRCSAPSQSLLLFSLKGPISTRRIRMHFCVASTQ